MFVHSSADLNKSRTALSLSLLEWIKRELLICCSRRLSEASGRSNDMSWSEAAESLSWPSIKCLIKNCTNETSVCLLAVAYGFDVSARSALATNLNILIYLLYHSFHKKINNQELVRHLQMRAWTLNCWFNSVATLDAILGTIYVDGDGFWYLRMNLYAISLTFFAFCGISSSKKSSNFEMTCSWREHADKSIEFAVVKTLEYILGLFWNKLNVLPNCIPNNSST